MNRQWRLPRVLRRDGGGLPDTLDLGFLRHATGSLHGHILQAWFRDYLDLIQVTLNRYAERRALTGLARPTAVGRRTTFDFDALDAQTLIYLHGCYFYVLAAHKSVNTQLMTRYDGKQVLYLRDFYHDEASALPADHSRCPRTTLDLTATICGLFDPHAHPEVRVIKVSSPEDLCPELGEAQQYLVGNDWPALVGIGRSPILSVYLNADVWRPRLDHLLDRADHYIVYVTTVTESVLWQLDQLARDDRRHRVTLVLDEAVAGRLPAPLLARFLVTSPEGFAADIERHRRRIADSSSRLRPGERETWLDFEFHPAVETSELARIQEFSAGVQAHLDEWTGARGIDCLPIFVNLVQLRIFCTLLMGRQLDTGRALACYAAVMASAAEHFSGAGSRLAATLPDPEYHLDLLTLHRDIAAGIGRILLRYGPANEFHDFTVPVGPADAHFDEAFARTRAAVDGFFAGRR